MIRSKSNRSNVEYHDISKNAINALLSTEDKRFYDHSGIDGNGRSARGCKIGP
ncbi:MAG: transglycosylase domain-containing protein [Puia sp.]